MELEEVVDSEKTGWCEIDVDMDSARKARRSSILKPQKPRNPLSTLDFSETNPDNTSVRASRRVSFASSNFVKPFTADPEKNTIWDNTYEEEVNHTDSTKSSCDQTHGTKTSQINMTSIYSITSEEVFHNEIMRTSISGEYVDIELTKDKLVNNVEHGGESLISFARKLRSNSTSEQSMSKTMDFTLIDTAGPVSTVKIVGDPQVNFPEVSTVNKLKNISCATKLRESTIEITSCITDKENVNPLINDLSLITSRQNNTICSNKTEYFNNEDLDLTTGLNTSEGICYFNESGINNLKTAKSNREKCLNVKEMDTNNGDSVMEFTCAISENNDSSNTSEENLPPKPLVINQVDDISVKTIYLDDSLNTMDFTNVGKIEEFKENRIDKTCGTSKRKTILFNETEGNMEMTRELTIRGDTINSKNCKTTGIIERPRQIEQVMVQSELGQTNRTIIFNQSENDMEITQNKGNLNTTTFQDILIPTQKEIIQESTSLGKIENSNKKKVYSDNKSKRNTIIFNETEGNMELTIANDNINVSLGGNIKTLENFPFLIEQKVRTEAASNQQNKTVFFDQSQDDMEFTKTLPVKIQNRTNLNTSVHVLTPKNKRQTIIFKNSGEDMEFTNTFNIHNVIEREKKMNDELKKLYSEQSEMGMELTNTLIGKINFAVSPTNDQESDMELTTALPSKTITENVRTNCGDENTIELDFLKKSKSTLEYTGTSVGKLNDFGTTHVELKDTQVANVSQDTIIGEKVTENVENNENIELSCNMTPYNIVKLKQCDKSLVQQSLIKGVDPRLLTPPEIESAELMTSDTNDLREMAGFTKLNISDRKTILPVREYEVSSISDLSKENIIDSLSSCNGDMLIPKSPAAVEKVQNNFICNATNNQNCKNDLSTANVIQSASDIKRHFTDCIDGDTAKKRRIEKSLTQKQETSDLDNLLAHINEQAELNLVDKLAHTDNMESRFSENNPEISRNQETNIKSAIYSNVLYSLPHMATSNSPPKFIPSTGFGTNLILGETLNVTTPATSFHMNLSCMEDTQQLIHATFSKPETLKMLGNFKDSEPSFNSMYKTDDLHPAEIGKNITYKLPKRSSCDEISTGDELPIPRLTEENSFDKGNKKSVLENFEKPKQSNCYADLLMDTTPPVEVADESNYSGSEGKLLHQSDSNKKLIPDNNHQHEQNECPENVSSDCMNYTLRAQTVINNIQKYLLRYEPVIQSADLQMHKLAKEFKENCSFIKELCKKKVHTVDLEEVHNQNEENSNSENDGIVHAKEDSRTPLTEGLVAPKTLCERICEMAKRTKKYWEYAKAEDDYYYFYTMFGTLPFKVHVHPEIGCVYSVATYSNLSDFAQPICHYHLKVFQNKLKQENLSSVLGQNFDIFTLLDYVYISMEEIIKFESEYLKLLKKYGETHHFRMNPDFSITFEILNVKLIIFWTITIKLSLTNHFYATKEDIKTVHKVGQNVNEDHIKTIAENATKGPNFLRNFIENVDEYVNRIGKRLRK